MRTTGHVTLTCLAPPIATGAIHRTFIIASVQADVGSAVGVDGTLSERPRERNSPNLGPCSPQGTYSLLAHTDLSEQLLDNRKHGRVYILTTRSGQDGLISTS